MQEGVSSSGSSSSEDVVVKSGAWKRPFKAGQTVAQYREQMSVQTSIPAGAQAYCGTKQLSDDDIVEPGMTIEFIKKTGEKG